VKNDLKSLFVNREDVIIIERKMEMRNWMIEKDNKGQKSNMLERNTKQREWEIEKRIKDMEERNQKRRLKKEI